MTGMRNKLMSNDYNNSLQKIRFYGDYTIKLQAQQEMNNICAFKCVASFLVIKHAVFLCLKTIMNSK